MKNFFFFTIFTGLFQLLFAGDTITVLHYNLLNYGNTTSYCTSTNNNIDQKDGYLQTIINYARPDVFCVNEIGSSSTNHTRILNNVLNINGISHYRRVTTTNNAGSDIVNMLYYNNNKLGFKLSTTVNTTVRDINIFKFFYRSADLASGDTTFITFILAHLKAGSDPSDAQKRADMINNLMNYLNNLGIEDNYVFSGDFNVYSSSEACFQNLINHSNVNIRFYDPINKIGNWNNNSYYAAYHTQSTDNGTNSCKASGGMDDRFDFIMLSNKIMNGTDKVRYINNTYWAIGNDGNHYNQSINYGTNNSVPSNVLSALAGMSDHLPVRCKLYIDRPAAINNEPDIDKFSFQIQNPVTDQLTISFDEVYHAPVRIQLFNLMGHKILEKPYALNQNSTSISLDVNLLPSGIYFVKVIIQGKEGVSAKVIKL